MDGEGVLMRLFFHQNIEETTLSEASSKHIVQVLRLAEGDEIELTNGQGHYRTAQIVEANKKKCLIELSELQEAESVSVELSLGISFTKNAKRMEWCLEKATEIGVKEIIPIIAQRSERTKINYERFQKILISAAIQSKQYFVPILRQATDVHAYFDVTSDSKFIAHCYVDIEREELSSSILNQAQRTDMRSVCLLIGPEGDFTDLEVKDALKHNFKSVSLGNNRLRTETAGVVGVTLLKHLYA